MDLDWLTFERGMLIVTTASAIVLPLGALIYGQRSESRRDRRLDQRGYIIELQDAVLEITKTTRDILHARATGSASEPVTDFSNQALLITKLASRLDDDELREYVIGSQRILRATVSGYTPTKTVTNDDPMPPELVAAAGEVGDLAGELMAELGRALHQ